jgi:hypothetical protein
VATHGSPTHYETLGVEPSASSDAVRKAYLKRARDHHPDFHTTATSAKRQENEREMQRINQAWTVLGDPLKRRAYDDMLLGGSTSGPSAPTGPAPARYDFVPYDDDDTDYAALLDDTPTNAVRMERSVQMAPAICLAIGLAMVIVGAIAQIGFALALGVAGVVIAIIGFLAAPAVAISRSLQSERES